MNCSSCGQPLPPGATFCTSCGAPVPYNMPGQNASPSYDPAAPPSPYNPTVMASPSPYNPTVMAGPPSYDPTIAASSYGQPGQQQPPTAYGAPSNPYEGLPAQDPYNPYNAAASPYGAPGPQPSSYPAYGYGNPPASPGSYMPGMQPGAYGTTAAPRRNRIGLIIGIAVLALVLVCGGLFAALAALSKNSPQTNTPSNSTATTTTGSTTATTTGNVPSASSAVPAAAAIIFHPQTASAIDKNYLPSQVTNTFTTNQTVYLTFSIDSKGQDGYVQVKWFEDGQLLDEPILHHHAQNDHGYFSLPYNQAGSGAAAMYWCNQASCSDAQLAQVVTFTISS